MKNTAYRVQQKAIFLIIVLIISQLFFSCEEDEKSIHHYPTISLVADTNYISSDTIFAVGQSYKVAIHAEFNGFDKLTNFIAKLNGERYLDLGIYKDVYDREIEITKGLEDTEEWEFIIRDMDGNTASTFLTIYKDQNIEYGDIDEFSNIKLGAQNNSDFGSFFSFSNGNDYDLESAFNNQELMDMVYYYDDFDKLEENIISSPGGNIDDAFLGEFGMTNWTTRNTIRFSREKLNITSEEFDIAANDSILLANSFAFESGGRKTKYLQAGDMYSFVTEDNVTGIFKVVETSGTTDGYIVFDIKIQK